MLSYIFMKILESRPNRYDRGIRLLTCGHAERIKQEIVSAFIHPGMRILDIGCGTGDLAVKAARAGALVTGLDISEGMLAVARRRIKDCGLERQIELHHAGVAEMDALFDDNSFDLVTSTLVISELYAQERQWTLRQAYRILKPAGRLIIAGEVQPKHALKKLLYQSLRLPLALVAYLVSQTGIRAVKDLGAELDRAGFEITGETRSFLESFATLSARKKDIPAEPVAAGAMRPGMDKSIAKTLFDYCGRWFPNPVEPGLRIIGTPDSNAPVIVTANFHLTVRRVEKALGDQDCYLLVAPTKGINVWCASAGGEMNTHCIVAVLKTSNVDERVGHRMLVLPQFAAPGVDAALLKALTGWKVKWGPVDVCDLPMFLEKGYSKSAQQCLARFPLAVRMELLFAMNLSIWLVPALIALVVHPAWALMITVIFWSAGLVLYAGYPWLPFQSGWLKALALGAVALAVFMAASMAAAGTPWRHSGWMMFCLLTILSIGFDLKGIVGGRTSEAERLMQRLGFDTFGVFFRAQGVHSGRIVQDKGRCINCLTCCRVCPMGVYGKSNRHVIIVNGAACLKCNACVRQCEKNALALV